MSANVILSFIAGSIATLFVVITAWAVLEVRAANNWKR
jgi:hypothetical protein